MNISELKTPIRIYWDLPVCDNGVNCLSIAEQIIALKILSLDLTVEKGTSDAIYLPLLERFASAQLSVSLTIPFADFTPAFQSRISRYRVKNLYAAIEGASDLARITPGDFKVTGVPSPGVSFIVTKDNYQQLPDIYSYCARHGFLLVLPMQRLLHENDYFALNREKRSELSGLIKKTAKPAGMKVTIHDPFLWRVFFPDIHFPNGRCQAANTMISIAANGDVYPCPSLPVVLGNVNDTTLSLIVLSEGKKELRKKLLKTPKGCNGCADIEGCLGGCRGRGYVATGSWEAPDPGCW